MKYENIARCALESLARDAEHAIVFPARRDVTGRHSLELKAEYVERICPFDRFLDAVEDDYAELLYRIREK